MGFGWMFLGIIFFTTGKLGYFDVLPDLFGYMLILHGIRLAMTHCNFFSKVKLLGNIGMVVSGVVMLLQALQTVGWDDNISELLASSANALNVSVRIVFIMLLLSSIHGLAKDVGAVKAMKRSLQMLFLVPVAAVAYIVFESIAYFRLVEDTSKIIPLALFCEILYVAFAFVATFSAYMWICVEGDENMTKTNNSKSPMDYFDRRKEKDLAEDQEYQRKLAAEKAGKSVAEMYGVKKKKKGKK